MTFKKATAQRIFLDSYARCGNITEAAAIADRSRKVVYEWLRDEPEFADKFADAKERAIDLLEKEARRRAVEGVKRYKFNRRGDPVLHPVTGEPYLEREFSDTLLIFLLKGARPDVYKERVATELSGSLTIDYEGAYERIASQLARRILEGADAGADNGAATNGTHPA